jgi:hypothetical protein
VQRIDGCRDDAWTMDNKKKRKRKEKPEERGRRRRRRRRGPLEERGWDGPRVSLYIRVVYSDTEEKAGERLSGGGWGPGLERVNWFRDFAPSGTIYKSALASSM